MSETTAPTPLPPEEIERLGAEIANGIQVSPYMEHKIALCLPALLAGIKAGRAGAERMSADAREVAVKALDAVISKRHGQPAGSWMGEARYEEVDAILAALRQAAQPADGAGSSIDPPSKEMVDWLAGYLGEVTKGGSAAVAANHIICTLRAHWGPPTAPAQVAAQPAGRVEACSTPCPNYPWFCKCEFVTPPTAGAGDGEQK